MCAYPVCEGSNYLLCGGGAIYEEGSSRGIVLLVMIVLGFSIAVGPSGYLFLYPVWQSGWGLPSHRVSERRAACGFFLPVISRHRFCTGRLSHWEG